MALVNKEVYHEDGFYYNHGDALSSHAMEVNATYIIKYFRAKGWSDNCIAAMLGNFHAESTINPARWENDTNWIEEGRESKGYGLAQWTPYNKYIKWCEDKGHTMWHLGTACLRVWIEFEDVDQLKENSDVYGSGQYYSTTEWDISRSEFIHSTDSPETLAKVFVRNYERPGSVLYDPDEETLEQHEASKAATYKTRAARAAKWWEFIQTGVFPDAPDPDVPVDPDDPTPSPGTGSRSSIIDYLTLYQRRRYRVVR